MNNLPAKPAIDITVAGENALLIQIHKDISPQSIAFISQLTASIQATFGKKLIDLIPAYQTILVVFDPWLCDHHHADNLIQQAWQNIQPAKPLPTQRLTLPVYYDLAVGPDLQRLADHHHLSIEAIIDIHQQGYYSVYAIGFAPGFAYLGHVDERIATPRLPTPRRYIPQGSVAIADRQTAVYPLPSPGGWNIIGRCPLNFFDPNATPPSPFTVGAEVRFEAIDQKTFLQFGGNVADKVV